MEFLTRITVQGLSILSTLFVLAIGFGVLLIVIMFLIYANQ